MRALGEAELELLRVQGHLQIHSEFKGSMNYRVRPYLKKVKKISSPVPENYIKVFSLSWVIPSGKKGLGMYLTHATNGSGTGTKSKISLRILGQASAILPCSPAELTAHFHREISCNALRWLREKQSSHVHVSHMLPTGPLKPYKKNTKDIQMLVPTTQIKGQSMTEKENEMKHRKHWGQLQSLPLSCTPQATLQSQLLLT